MDATSLQTNISEMNDLLRALQLTCESMSKDLERKNRSRNTLSSPKIKPEAGIQDLIGEFSLNDAARLIKACSPEIRKTVFAALDPDSDLKIALHYLVMTDRG